MLCRNAPLHREVTEQTALRINMATHSSYLPSNNAATVTCHRDNRSGGFSTAC
jgi:hypothetical protein